MNKRIIIPFLLLLSFAAGAQNRVPADSLVKIITRESGFKVYFLKDRNDDNLYQASDSESALAALKEKGYIVSRYDGSLFIMKGKSLSPVLPVGYFDQHSGNDNAELLQYINDRNAVAEFQNKVYDIGDRNHQRSGKVYLTGHVRNVQTGEPLIGVSVSDPETGAYSVTDADGVYSIQLPVGERKLDFSGYSLDDMHLNLKVWSEGSLDIVMKEKVISLKGAVVSADASSHHKSSLMGVEKVRISTIQKVPTAFGEADVLKVVLTLPGVKSVGEASSGFNVRGGSSDQNLILFNDGTIFNPSHMFGLFSAFDPDVINDVELYKSSIPAEYGGRISSVLDVRGREGNSNKVTGSLGIGLLTSRFHVEGPIKKGKTTFIVGGRTTYSDWILKMLPKDSEYSGGKAAFSDVTVGLSHKFNSNHSLKVNGYWSRDRFSFSRDTSFAYQNLNLSAKYRGIISERLSLTVSGGYDSYDNTVKDSYDPYTSYSVNTTVNQAFLKASFKQLLGQKHSLSYGLNVIDYFLNPGIRNPLGSQSLIASQTLPLETALEPAVFISDSWKTSDKFDMDFGIRYAMFAKTQSNKAVYGLPELRLSAKYSPLSNLSFKAGINTMTQNIHLLSNTSSISPMDTWKLSDSRIRPQTGWQAAGGLYWTFANSKVDFSLEGYWKNMYHYLDYKPGAVLVMNPDLADDLVETEGKAYGVEVMLRKNIGKLNGWISYTYSRTMLKEMEDRGISTINGGNWYPAAHDKPHDVKFVGNYKFTHRYSISMNLDYSTGRPITVPVGKYLYAGGYRLAYSDKNSYRIPDYFRLDLAVNIDPSHYKRQFIHTTFTFGVYNVTGRKNPYSVFYTTSGGSAISGHMVSVFATQIPYVNVNLKF